MDTLYCKDLSRIEATILPQVVPPSKTLWLPFKHIYNKCDHAPLHGVHEAYIDMTDPGNICPENLVVIVQLSAHMCRCSHTRVGCTYFIDLPSTPQYVCDTKRLYLKWYTQIRKHYITNTETRIQYIQEWVPTDMAMGVRQNGYGLYHS